MASCPCQVHTASRGHEWVVFRRQLDRTPTLYYEQTESESEEEIQEEYNEDDDYFSEELVDIDNDEKKKTRMFLEQQLLKFQLMKYQLMIQQRSLNMKIIHLYTPGRIRKQKGMKRSLKRSPLIVMKKIWNPKILMTLMNKWMLQEAGEPTTFVSSL